MYYSARSGYGPEAIPGDYSVELVMPNKKLVSSLNVKIDPRWNIPKSDLEKQFNTANEVISMIEESQEKLNEMMSNPQYCQSKGLYSKADVVRNSINNVLRDYEMTTLGNR